MEQGISVTGKLLRDDYDNAVRTKSSLTGDTIVVKQITIRDIDMNEGYIVRMTIQHCSFFCVYKRTII